MTVNMGMVDVTGPQRLSVEQAVAAVENGEKTYDCILVLGAGLQPDGRPSAMLHDRVEVGCAAYFACRDGQNGRLPILMSGDHTGDYNEVAAMKRLAFELGVPGRDVFLDHGGFSTYESLYRAKQVFGARRVLIVTQGYHLHRALYIAREMGLEADGVAADLRLYRSHTKRIVREWLARYKDFWKAARGVDVDTGGEVYDLSGDGAMTHRS